jgi:hypothetical protein
MTPGLTSYDRLLARRAVALGIALSVLLAVMISSTDEGEATFGARLGRFASLVALAGGVSAFVTTEQARSRGEARALGAIGVAPTRASLGAALGGTLVAAVGPAVALLPIADIGCLYPSVGPSAGSWISVGPAAWRQALGTVVVRAAGEIDAATGTAAEVAFRAAEVPRLVTSAVLVAFAVAVPFWATATRSAPRRLVVGLAAAIGAVALFHLVAVARAPSGLLLVPPLVLALDAWVLGTRGAWR